MLTKAMVDLKCYNAKEEAVFCANISLFSEYGTILTHESCSLSTVLEFNKNDELGRILEEYFLEKAGIQIIKNSQ